MHDSFPFTSDAEIASIGNGLLHRTLPKPEWTHAAHFAAALWFLDGRPERDVRREIAAAIRAYNLATGVANTESTGYHETITLASVRAARFHLDRHAGRPLFEIANAVLASELGNPNWLLAHWSRARLFSAYARLNWCEPDIDTLPF